MDIISGGKVASTQDSTIVRIETEEGLVGWGEQCVFSPNYLVAHGEGARAALSLLAPAVIGMDPRQTEVIYEKMERTLKGRYYAKAAIDIACWDLLGKATGLSIGDLLGGVQRTRIPLYAPISMGTPDANGNWTQYKAAAIVSALDGLKIFIEQPCATAEECARVRSRARHAFILDESLLNSEDILRAYNLEAMDAVMLKLSRFGGITPIKKARDLATYLKEWDSALPSTKSYWESRLQVIRSSALSACPD